MKHKWIDGKCTVCGLRRKVKSWKLRMAITNEPPYDHYMRGTKMAYSWNGERWDFTRPECYRPATHP